MMQPRPSRRHRRSHDACAVCRLLLLAILTPWWGCAPAKPPTAASRPVSLLAPTDPCAARLHDILGGILQHYHDHGQLPVRLDEISKVPGVPADEVAFVCPVSGKPYIYSSTGNVLPEQQQRIILYDPLPSHAHMRWAIRLQEPVPGQPLVLRVVALPESFFVLHPPR